MAKPNGKKDDDQRGRGLSKVDPRKLAAQVWDKAAGPDEDEARDCDLTKLDSGAKLFSTGDKPADKALVEQLAVELDLQQNVFYATKKFRLLIVLQGIDTSGKDGTLRGVFSRMSPLGVHTTSWKAPNEEEKAHDYLWRIHQQVPPLGEITVFNRSHYEDVLVPVVERWITPQQTLQRYQQINDFERMLCENQTVVLKFMLHISKDEQRERLQERVDDPQKRWKLAAGDLVVRKQWDDYERAYGNMIAATGTPWAPWVVVPADSKTHRNLMIATLVSEAIRKLDLELPAGDPSLIGLKVV